jgi:hypothetical protein
MNTTRIDPKYLEKKLWVWDILQIAPTFTQNREKFDLLKGSFLNVLLIHVVKGSEILAHYEDYDAIFYILEGTGIIQIGNEKISVKPGMMVYSPKTELRGIFPDSTFLIMGLQEPH